MASSALKNSEEKAPCGHAGTSNYRKGPQQGQIVTIYHNGDRLGYSGTAKRSGYKLKPIATVKPT